MKVSKAKMRLASIITKPFSRMTEDQWSALFDLLGRGGYSYHPKIRALWKKRYMTSHVWKKKRQEWIKDTHNCQKCGSTQNLQIDHLVTAEQNGYEFLGKEGDKDIQVICRKCHFLTGKARRQI